MSKYRITSSLQPREKLWATDATQLTDKELVAVILGSGIKGRRIGLLAQDVLNILDHSNYRINVKELITIPGLGKAKAALLAAAFELTRRINGHFKIKVQTPSEAIQLVSHLTDRKQEYFICIALNGAYEVINKRIVSIGLLNRTVVHPREVYADAIIDRAAAIICVHNHPSGHVDPSREDREVTAKLSQAGRIIGIQLLDHIIFTHDNYYSFQEQGELREY